jgi:hypothetical protein
VEGEPQRRRHHDPGQGQQEHGVHDERPAPVARRISGRAEGLVERAQRCVQGDPGTPSRDRGRGEDAPERRVASTAVTAATTTSTRRLLVTSCTADDSTENVAPPIRKAGSPPDRRDRSSVTRSTWRRASASRRYSTLPSTLLASRSA